MSVDVGIVDIFDEFLCVLHTVEAVIPNLHIAAIVGGILLALLYYNLGSLEAVEMSLARDGCSENVKRFASEFKGIVLICRKGRLGGKRDYNDKHTLEYQPRDK
jgi:hypothetical protein